MSYQLRCQQALVALHFPSCCCCKELYNIHKKRKEKKCWIVEWFLAPRANSRRLYRLLLQGLLLLFSFFLIFFSEFFCDHVDHSLRLNPHQGRTTTKKKDLPVNGLSFVCLLFSQEYQQLLLKLERGGGNLLEMPTHNERTVRISINSKLARHHPAG